MLNEKSMESARRQHNRRRSDCHCNTDRQKVLSKNNPAKATARISHLLLMGSLLSCSNAFASSLDHAALDIRVSAASYTGKAGDMLESACAAWSLTPSQVQDVFALSDSFQTSPYSSFYQLPCSISGDASIEGRRWQFVINGGGEVTLSNGDDVRYLGCRDKRGEPYTLLLTDDMEGS